MKRLLCVVLLWAVPALADITPDVKRYLVSAAALFERLEYEKSLAQIKRAKTKSQTPEDDTLIALYEGVVLAEMGDAQAATAFTTALGLDPQAQLPMVVSPKVQRVFDKAKAGVTKLLEAQEAAEKARAEEQRKQEEANKPPEPAKVEAPPAPPPEPVVVKKPPPEPSRGRMYAGLGVAVAGVAVAGTGAAMMVLGHSAGQSIAAGTPATYADAMALAKTGQTEQTASVAMLAVGGAALAAGIALFALGPTYSYASASVIVVPNGGAAMVRFALP
jgi:hypothetical protein